MKINAVKAKMYAFKGFSDDIRRARTILDASPSLDNYLKDGRTVIIEKVEINDNGEKKSAHENLKKVGQGAAAGVAGGATGSVIAKSKNTAETPDDAIVDNQGEIEDWQAESDSVSENLSDTADNMAEAAKSATVDLDDDFAEIAKNCEVDDAAEAANGILGCFKEFFKSLLDLD